MKDQPATALRIRGTNAVDVDWSPFEEELRAEEDGDDEEEDGEDDEDEDVEAHAGISGKLRELLEHEKKHGRPQPPGADVEEAEATSFDHLGALPQGWMCKRLPCGGGLQYCNERLGRVQFRRPLDEGGHWEPPEDTKEGDWREVERSETRGGIDELEKPTREQVRRSAAAQEAGAGGGLGEDKHGEGAGGGRGGVKIAPGRTSPRKDGAGHERPLKVGDVIMGDGTRWKAPMPPCEEGGECKNDSPMGDGGKVREAWEDVKNRRKAPGARTGKDGGAADGAAGSRAGGEAGASEGVDWGGEAGAEAEGGLPERMTDKEVMEEMDK